MNVNEILKWKPQEQTTSSGSDSSGKGMTVSQILNYKPEENTRRNFSETNRPTSTRRDSGTDPLTSATTRRNYSRSQATRDRDTARNNLASLQREKDALAGVITDDFTAAMYADKLKELDQQIAEAKSAYNTAKDNYKDVFSDYNSARREVRQAEKEVRNAESLYSGWITDDLSAQNARDAMNTDENVKAARERLANARAAFVEQGGNPDANVISAGLKGSASGVIDTFGYLQELAQPENEKSWGIFTTGHMTEQQKHHQQVLEQRQKAKYESEHGVGTYEEMPQYQRTQNVAGRLANESAEEITSMKTGRNALGQFAVDMGVQGVQMGADMVAGKVLPGGSLTAMALRSFGSGVREARDEGANIYQQGLYGAGSAAVEVLSEKMFDGLAGAYGAGVADDLVSQMIGKFTKNKLGQAALGWAADAIGEGAEEVFSDLVNPVLKSIYDDTVWDNGFFGAYDWSQVGYDFLVGAAMGAVGGSVENIANMTGLSAPDERSKFFMNAGQSGMTLKDAVKEWKRHEIKMGYATQTGDMEITNQANEYLARLDEGKKVSERKITKLNQRAVNQIATEDIANTASAVQQRMQELGVNDERLAQAVAAVALEKEAERIGAKGVNVTEAQRQMIKDNQIAQRVLFEMDVENMRSEQRAGFDAFMQNKTKGATKEDYERAVNPYVRTNEWAKTMQKNKALATDVYGAKASVSETEKTGNVSFTNKKGNAINGQIIGVKDGKVRIKHGKDGKLISDVAIDQIQGLSDEYRSLITAAASRKNGSVMLQAYRPGQDIRTFLQQWDLAENGYGLTNISNEKARNVFSLRNLTDAQLDLALELGRENAKDNTAEKATQRKVTGELSFWEGGKIDGMDYDATTAEEAKKLLGESEYGFASDVLSKIVNVTFVKSKAGKSGSFTGAQGIFFRDGQIFLDVNAGLDAADVGQRTIILTAAHELTHYIRAYNEEAYNTLRDFIVSELVDQGKNIEDFIRDKQKRAGWRLTNDEAMEEVVADACEMMLTDADQIAAFANQHTTEARTIWGWLDKFFSKVENAFSGLTARHEEAKAMQGKITEMRKMWLDALAGANDNALAAQVSNPADAVHEENGAIESNGTMMNSLRTFEEDGRDALNEFLDKQVETKAFTEEEANQMRKQIEEIYKVCKDYDNGEFEPFSAWSNAEVITIDGKPVFSVVKQNGEYKLNLDFSLVCKKRRTLDAVFNEMIKRGIMNDFRMGQGSIAKINEIIRDHGFEVACGLCFVDSKRYRQAMIADAFCKMYNMQVFSLMKGTGAKVDSFNFGGDATIINTGEGIDTLPDSKLNWEKVDEILRTEKKGTVKYKIADHLKNNPQDRKLVSRGDFMSTAGFDQLKIRNPELLSIYNSKKGAGGPKAAQSDVQYLNEIIKQGQFNVKDAYEVGGVRIQSFSDYVGRLVFDYVQMVADLSAKKLPAHSYTKEFMFAQQFGLTGIKINMSLVPEVVKGIDKDHAGLDADGNYTWKDGQSFGSTVYDNNGKRLTANEGFELAKKIQNAEGYSKNCGTIAVGVSRAHIEKMLDDPEIRMIIPYHKSGLNHLVAAMNQIDKYTDYTNVQNTREFKNGKWSRIPAAKEFNWNDTLQRMQAEGKGAKEAAKAYLDWCTENGYKAKFDEFAGHPNYYKLLEDFSCYDKDGTTSTPLGAVQMNFPTENDAFGSMKDLIRAGLEEDAMLQAKQEGGVDDIVDEIQSVLPAWEEAHPEGKAKHADRDAGGHYDYSKSFAEQIDDYKSGQFPKYDTLIVRGTPKVFQKIGLNALPMTYGTGHLQEVLDGVNVDHDFGEAMLKQLPEKLEEPIAIFTSASHPTTSIVALVDLVYRGKHIITPIVIDGTGTANGLLIDTNAITSAHTRGNAINGLLRDAIKQEAAGKVGVFYYDKSKTIGLLNTSELQLLGLKSDANGFIHSIRETGSPVKPKLNSAIESKQFKKWFGKSKVVNPDGTPKVMYHGTSSQFTVFQRDKIGSNAGTGWGPGFYFTDKQENGYEDGATDYGDIVMPVYLKIEKPMLDTQKTVDREKFVNTMHKIEAGHARWHKFDFEAIYDDAKSDADLFRAFNGREMSVRFAMSNDEVIEAFKSLGFDGLMARFGNANHAIVFDSTQIKSATDNIGLFDGKNPDIRYSLRDNADAIAEQKRIGKERLDKLRAEKNEKIAGIRKEETARRQTAVKKEKAAKWEKVKETKNYYQDMMKRQRGKKSDTSVRAKIKALHKELTDILLKPKEGRYVPKELVKATAEILGAIDTTSGRAVKAKAALAELKVKYDALAKDTKYAITYDDTISGMIQNLAENVGDGSIYDLTGTDLEAVYNTLKALKHTIVTANKLVGAKIEADAFEAATQMMNETENAKGIPTKALRRFVMTQLTPSSAFRMFGGYVKNSMWEQMFNELNNGQLTQTQVLMEGGNIFRELIDDKKNMDKLHDQKHLLDIGLKDPQGNPILVTRGMMLSVYMHLLNEQNSRHVAYGGLTVPRLKQYYKNNMKDAYKGETGRAVAFATEIADLNEQLKNTDDVQEQEAIKDKIAELQDKTDAYMSNLRSTIEEQLTEYDRKWIAAAQEFFNVYSKGKLNEVTEMVYGFSKAQVDNYFPIHTDPDYRSASFDTIVRDMNLENAGFMKERVNGANPILLEDITDVISSQLRRTAQYVGLMPAIKNFNKVYGKARAGYSMSVQSAMSRKFEGEGQKYIENLMADLNGARKTEANIFDELRGNMAGAVLTLNPRVAMAQAASYPTAASEIGYKPLIKALKDIKNNPNWNEVARDEVAKWTPLWWYRMQGFSTVELGDIKNNEQALSKVLQKMKWATGWIQFMDGATTGALWQASKYYVDENFTDLKKGSDEYMMKVAEVYNRVIEKTQPDYTTMQRPDILRNPNAIVKQLTMFMTQRLQNTNILYDAAATYSHYVRDLDAGRNGVTAADVKQAKTRLVWAVSSQVAAGATIVIFKAIADALMHNLKAYRDDDDELTAESISKTMLTNFVETLTSNVLWGSELFAALKSVVTGDRYYGISLNGVDTFKDILEDGVKTLSKAWKGDWEGFKAPAWKLSKAVAQFFGIPLGNAEKVGKMTANWFEDARNGTWYESDVDRTKAQNTHILFDALQRGDTAKATRIRQEFKDKKDEQSALKSYIQELYTGKDQKIQKAETIKLLQQYCGLTKREAEDIAQKWTMEVVTGIKFSELQDKYIAGEIPKAKAEKYYKDYSSNGRTTVAEAEAKVNEWTCEKETGIAYSDIGTEVKTGRLSQDKAVKMVMKYGGKDEDAATKTVNGYLIEHEYDIKPSELEEQYMAGDVSDEDALDILLRYRYYGKDEAEKKASEELERMRFVRENPDAEDISVTQVRNYNAAELNGVVSASVYAEAAKMMGTFHGYDNNGDGKTDSYSIIIQKLEYIDTLDLDPEQKTRLAQALGISDKNIRRRAPWR